MTDEELQRIVAELDGALEIMRRQGGREVDTGDEKIREMIAGLRRELAVYRELAQTAARQKR